MSLLRYERKKFGKGGAVVTGRRASNWITGVLSDAGLEEYRRGMLKIEETGFLEEKDLGNPEANSLCLSK